MAISFDGATKIISLSAGTTSLSVRDLWSRWVDWLSIAENTKYAIAMSEVGGDDIDLSAGTKIPAYVFLENGWRLRPFSGNHTLNVYDGVLLVAGGGDPFINPIGSYVIRINYQQPVQAISFSTTGSSAPTLTAAQVWEYILENGLSAEQVQRVILAATVGRTAGIGTSEEYYLSQDETKIRIDAKFDENGNRIQMDIDGT